jgi:type IV pilus biogenesis protein CpaD/CtpE
MAPFPRFLLTPRKFLRHGFVLAIVAGCVVAGFWQRDRLIQVRAYNRQVERQGALPPIALDALIPTGSAPAATASAASSSSASSAAPGGVSPTRTARSNVAGRHVADSGDSEP